MLDMNGESTRISELSHSPRAHRRSRSSNYFAAASPASVLPKVSRFFADEPLPTSAADTYTSKQGACSSSEHSSSLWKETSSSWKKNLGQKSSSPPVLPLVSPRCGGPTTTSNLASYKQIVGVMLAAAVSLCAVIPWLHSRGGGDMYHSNNVPKYSTLQQPLSQRILSLRGGSSFTTTNQANNHSGHDNSSSENNSSSGERRPSAAAAAAAAEAAAVKCHHRKQWHDPSASTPSRAERAQCSRVLPAPVLENEGWLLAIHMDRASTTQASNRRLRVRGGRREAPVGRHHRDLLPHQYFVRVVEAALAGIADAEAGASVDVVVFSEGQLGGLVDEVGMGVEWDLPGEVCQSLGLTCTQVRGERSCKRT